MTIEYWLAKSSYEEKDIFQEISQKCSLSEENSSDLFEFIETVEAVSDGGGIAYFEAVYGPQKTKLFEDTSREIIRTINTVDAHLLKTMPLE